MTDSLSIMSIACLVSVSDGRYAVMLYSISTCDIPQTQYAINAINRMNIHFL